jgi:hypothetical protein
MALSQREILRVCADFKEWERGHKRELAARAKQKEELALETEAPPGLTCAEAEFYEAAKAKQGRIYRHGWPDFLVEFPDRTIGVEVKQGQDVVSARQARTFAALERLGLAVFVWNPANPGKLSAWRKCRKPRPRVLSKIEKN